MLASRKKKIDGREKQQQHFQTQKTWILKKCGGSELQRSPFSSSLLTDESMLHCTVRRNFNSVLVRLFYDLPRFKIQML